MNTWRKEAVRDLIKKFTHGVDAAFMSVDNCRRCGCPHKAQVTLVIPEHHSFDNTSLTDLEENLTRELGAPVEITYTAHQGRMHTPGNMYLAQFAGMEQVV